MNNYDASMSFKFMNCGNLFFYNGKTGEVTGQTIRDPIKYTPSRVNECLKCGDWAVVETSSDELMFPRAGIYAKCMTKKVFIVGKTPKGQWVVYNYNGEISVDPFCLEELSEADERIFSVMVDLDLDYHRAERLILKGYVKQ